MSLKSARAYKARQRQREQDSQQGSESYEKMPGLVLDFSNTDRKWQRRWMAVLSAESELESFLDIAELDAEADLEVGIELPENIAEELKKERLKLANFEEQRDKMILGVVVKVPESVLRADAPEDLDWNDRASLDYIRGDRWGDLVVGITVASNGNVRANF